MEATTDWPRRAWMIAACLGIGLVILSLLWSVLFPPTAVWKPEQAQEYTRVGARLHALTVQLSAASRNPATRDSELAQVESLRREQLQMLRRWEELGEELEAAKRHGRATQSVLRWIGGGLAVLGLVGLLATRESK